MEKHQARMEKKMDKAIDTISKTNQLDKTWAQVAATPHPGTKYPAMVPEKKQQLEQARKERAQYEVTLSADDAPPSTNEVIATTHAKDITAHLQKFVDKANLLSKPKVQGINRLGRKAIWLQMKTAQGAKEVKEANINWNEAYNGLSLYKPKYGVVVHGVPTEAINFDTDITAIKNEWEKENSFKIVNI